MKTRKRKRIDCVSRLYLLLCLLWLTGIAEARSLELELGDYLELENSGIRFRPFAGYELQPLPPLTTYTIEHSVTGQRRDVHDPHEYFRHRQREAVLSFSAGQVDIAVLRYDVPAALPLVAGAYVAGREFDALLTARRPLWDDPMIDKWVGFYTGLDIVSRSTRVRDFNLLLPYIAYTFDTNTSRERTIGFVMRIPDTLEGTRLIFFHFRFPDHVRVANADRAIAAMLASLRPARRAHIRRVPHAGYQVYDRSRQRPEHLVTRQEVIRNLRNLDDWWYVETPNYILASDLGPDNRELVRDIQADVEDLRDLFARLVPPLSEIRDVSVIRVFAERRDYLRFVPETMQWTAGAWLPAQNELVVGPPADERYLGDGRRVLLMVYHEAFHQYLYYAADRQPFPVWYDEGHAALIEGVRFRRHKGRVRIGEVPHYREQLFHLIDTGQDDLRDILAMEDKAFYAMDRRHSYPLAWGLVYFLRKATPLFEDRRYHGFCELVYREAVEEQARTAELAHMLGETYDLSQLQKDFRLFWGDRRARSKAERHSLVE